MDSDTISGMLKGSGFTLDQMQAIVRSPRKWVETFCRNPENDQPIKLNIVQRAVFDAAESQNPHNVLNAHRRSGKSLGLILLAASILMTRRNVKILFMAPFNAQVEAFFNELRKIIAFHPWMESCVVESTKNPYFLKFSNGSQIRGMTTGSKSKSKAGSARGQGAHFILLDEVAFMSDDDFASLKPIIEGDAYHRPPVVFAASTPMGAVGQFYRWVENIRPETVKLDADGEPMKDDLGNPILEDYVPWNVIEMPITRNPDWDKRRIDRIRNEVTAREWKTEYLCEFLNTGDTVFDLAALKRCGSLNYNYADVKPKPYPVKDERTGRTYRTFWRTMGVDWDKYNRDGAGPTIVILDCDERPADSTNNFAGGDGRLRIVYRESIPQSEYCLTAAVNRVIELNRLYSPDSIYVDAGAGEMQVEYLHKYGKQHPETRLRQKVRRQHFSEIVEIQDPLGGTLKKGRFKNLMVNVLTKWIEDEALEYPSADKDLYEQFSSYRVKAITLQGETYTSENEHIIDAAGLAAVAMFQIHASPFRHQPTTLGVAVPPQEVVPGEQMTDPEFRDLRRRSPVTALLVSRDRPAVQPNLMDFRPKTAPDTSTLFPRSPKDQVGAALARPARTLMTGRRRGAF